MNPAELANLDQVFAASQHHARRYITWVAGIWALHRRGRTEEADNINKATVKYLTDLTQPEALATILTLAAEVVRRDINNTPGATPTEKRDTYATQTIDTYEAAKRNNP